MTKPAPIRNTVVSRESTGARLLRILTGIAALIGLAALMVGMPLLLWAVRDVGTLHIEWTFAGLWRALLRPDDGTLFLALVKLAGWITWAVLLTSIVIELIGRIRHVRVPNLQGLGVPQAIARGLVAAVAALFLTTSGQLPKIPVATAEPVPPPVPAAGAPAHARQPTHARQPAHTTRSPQHYTVRKGDTLSQIALDKLGNAHRYPEIFKASRDIRQPGGRRLIDPDVIDIGWKLSLPAKSKGTANRRDHVETPDRPARSTTGVTPPRAETQATRRPGNGTPSPSPPAVPSSTVAPTAAPAPTGVAATPAPGTSADHTTEADHFQPGWLLTGLAGAGGILGGSMWLALRRRRALQSHHRRHGFMIAPPPPVTIPVEKTLRHVGAPIAHRISFIDDALRRTAHAIMTAGSRLPAVQALKVTDSQLVVHLCEPGKFPAPWREGDNDTWQVDTSADLDAIGPSSAGGPSPWPHLVTLGTDPDGHCWLVNLEAFGIATITGDAS